MNRFPISLGERLFLSMACLALFSKVILVWILFLPCPEVPGTYMNMRGVVTFLKAEIILFFGESFSHILGLVSSISSNNSSKLANSLLGLYILLHNFPIFTSVFLYLSIVFATISIKSKELIYPTTFTLGFSLADLKIGNNLLESS